MDFITGALLRTASSTTATSRSATSATTFSPAEATTPLFDPPSPTTKFDAEQVNYVVSGQLEEVEHVVFYHSLIITRWHMSTVV